MKVNMFPKSLFPSKFSILGFVTFLISLFWLVNTVGVIPLLMQELGEEFIQPKSLNSLFLVGFLVGTVLYALERRKYSSKG